MRKKSKRVNDCPNLDSIQTKERRLIKMRQELKEQKRQTIKTRTGKSVPIPSLQPKPVEVGISLENGTPTKPKLDTEVRKRGCRSKKI